MSDDPKLDKIVAARMKLRARFEEHMRATPSLADPSPLGSGPLNRHGMPQLPVGQHAVEKWPVLDLGMQPTIPIERWALRVDGAVEAPVTLSWNDFLALEQVEDVSDFHCVTTWSRMDVPWVGVRFADVIALARPLETATHAMCHAYDGYSTNVSLAEALKPDVLLVHRADGEPLRREHGGPVRMITPQLYAWKGAKWIQRIELMAGDRPGFWEQRGYSMTALPWRDDRYS
ncbi:MAG: sulfite oxidase-like oxidoreductase [bacterium]